MFQSIDESVRRAAGCNACAESISQMFGRRGFLMTGAAALAGAALAPTSLLAAGGQYEAMVLSCIDPRFHALVAKYTTDRNLAGKYSQVALAGAGIAAVAPAFKDWHKAFWDNLAASIQLHAIGKVIVVNHRDCGAAKIAYGDSAVADASAETKTHREALAEFRKQLKERQPKLTGETGLMALDGKIEMFTS